MRQSWGALPLRMEAAEDCQQPEAGPFQAWPAGMSHPILWLQKASSGALEQGKKKPLGSPGESHVWLWAVSNVHGYRFMCALKMGNAPSFSQSQRRKEGDLAPQVSWSVAQEEKALTQPPYIPRSLRGEEAGAPAPNMPLSPVCAPPPVRPIMPHPLPFLSQAGV